jgi:hypothetical protein
VADLRSYNQGLDYDTGGGTDYIAVHGIVVPASGGAVSITGDASNGLDVDVTRVSGTVTCDTELPAAAALATGASNPTAPAVGAFGMLWNGTTWDRAPGSAAGGQSVTVQNASLTVDTELPAAAALADATANPTVPGVGAFLMGYNGTTWDRARTANTGRLQVDVLSGGGADTPTSPTNTYVTSASLAAGSSANLDTGELGAVKLAQVEVWASVAYKAAVYTIINGSASANPIAIGGGQPFVPFTWKPPHRNYAAVTANAGVDGFRVAVTNLDDANAADVYASFHTES